MLKFVNKDIKKRKTMKEVIEINWKGDMGFNADVDEHRIVLDAKAENGGKNEGPRPKPLLMVSLAGCTGMDVVSLLKKMRVELDDFKINVEGVLTEEHPKHYTSMHITYLFKGKDLDMDKIKRAIELSQEKYCGVSILLKKALKLTWEIKIM